MTFDGRLLLRLLALLMIIDLTVESRYHHLHHHHHHHHHPNQHRQRMEDTLRHRHRHRHELAAINRKNHHDSADRRSSWTQDLDYDDYPNVGTDRYEGDDGEEDTDDDYDTRSHHERTSNTRNRPKSRYNRIFGYRHTNGWGDVEDEDEDATTKTSKSKHRAHLDEEESDYYDDEPMEDEEIDWYRGYEDEVNNSHRSNRRFRNHPIKEKKRNTKRHRHDHNESIGEPNHSTDKMKNNDDDEEEDDIDDDEELDNDFHKDTLKTPLKTYDDIIRRLTSEDGPTTVKPSTKRDYRNIENYLKKDVYGNLKYDGKQQRVQKITYDRHFFDKRKDFASRHFITINNNKTFEQSSPFVMMGDQRINITYKGKDEDSSTKSFDPDYEDYLNSNEKDDDSTKIQQADLNSDSFMQADINNTDYSEESMDEDEGSTEMSATPTSTVSNKTTTSTTTSTVKPIVTQNYDYRDSRAYESGTGVQYNGYQSKHEYPAMSAHSVHKWQSLGTRESVKETRSNIQHYNKNGKTADMREAIQHAIKVSREGSCQWPRARVIPVRDVYPSPSITYIPHCAILHRCSDDTGCCRSEALTCVPKQSHRVELYFYTTNEGGSSVVEKLSFYNHTECECKEKTKYESTNERSSDARVQRNNPSSLLPPQTIKKVVPKKPCRCPSEFTPRITSGGACQCNCFENDQACIRTRRGKGYFSLRDRLCIQNEECATPNCEFGEYIKRQGKCPRKKDKFDAIVNYQTSVNHRLRS